jgi:hypothetical protein
MFPPGSSRRSGGFVSGAGPVELLPVLAHETLEQSIEERPDRVGRDVQAGCDFGVGGVYVAQDEHHPVQVGEAAQRPVGRAVALLADGPFVRDGGVGRRLQIHLVLAVHLDGFLPGDPVLGQMPRGREKPAAGLERRR